MLEEHLIQLKLIVAVLKWIAAWHVKGAVLVFLPGWSEINACLRDLRMIAMWIEDPTVDDAAKAMLIEVLNTLQLVG